MNSIKLFVEGFIIGLAKIIPGVSGSVLAIVFGLYEKLISCVCSFRELKGNFRFLAILGSGIFLAILIGSNAIKFLLTNHYIKTMMFFIGMMIPGIIPLFKNVNNRDVTWKRIAICIALTCFLFILSIVEFDSNNVVAPSYLHEFISLFLCGILDAASAVIPGISGSALLMLIGYYEVIITSIANILTLTNISYTLSVLIPFSLGIIVGIILVSKFINYLFKHHRVITYMMIIVFASYSIIILFINSLSMIGDFWQLLTGILFLAFGFLVTYLLEITLSK